MIENLNCFKQISSRNLDLEEFAVGGQAQKDVRVRLLEI